MASENIRIKYTVDKKQLDDSNKALSKSVDENEDLQKEVTKTGTSFAGLGGQLKAVANKFTIAGKGAGDMATSMFAVSNATAGTSKALRILKVALASTGIGLLIVAIGSLTAAFKSSETGQNKFAKIMAGLGVIVGNVSDIFANIGEAIIEAFENPKKTINAFVDLVKNTVIRSFNGWLELIPQLGKAVMKLFEGDFAGAAEVAVNAVAKATLGIEDLTGKTVAGFEAATEAVKEFSAQTQKEVNQALALADKRAATDIKARQFLIDTARLESQVADLRLKGRQEDEFTAIQRVEFLKEANVLQNQLIETELEIAKNRAEEATISNTFSKSTKENLDEEAALIANVFQVEAKRLNQQRQLQREINTTTKQAQAAASAQAKASAEQVNSTLAGEQELAIFRLEQSGLLIEAEILKNAILLENEALTSDERTLIKEKEAAKILEIETALANEKVLIDALVKEQRTEIAMNTLNSLAVISGKEAALGKALAIRQVTIDTYKGAQAAFSALAGIPIVGPALGGIAAGLAVAAGLKNVQQIVSVAPPKFEKGGRIGGKLHSQGGTLVEAELDEHMINRKATAKYGHGLFDRINKLELNPDIVSGKTGGSSVTVVDTTPIANAIKKQPQTSINIDEEGFGVRQRRNQTTYISKLNRYST